MNPLLNHALALHRQGRYADAARFYHALIVRDPDEADALHLFGAMHQECGYAARAVELIGRAVTLRPDCAMFHANLAEAYRALGRHEEAAASCRAALRIQPRFPEASSNLGMAMLGLGRPAEAVGPFEEALRMRPAFADARNNLGTALLGLGRTREALAAFERAVADDPALAVARANLGQVLVDLGRVEEGLAHCREAVRLRPGVAGSWNNLGNALRAVGSLAEAHAAFAEAVRLAPDAFRIHLNRGLAFHADHQLAPAAESLRAAIALEPENPDAWRALLAVLLEDEDPAAAVACGGRLVELEPGRAENHCDLGWALQREARHAEAAACYRRALEIRPDLELALRNLGDLAEECGDLDEAEAWYRRAIAADPRATGGLAGLANLLRGRLPAPDLAGLAARAEDPSLDDRSRADLLFGLAHVEDARGRHAEAAAGLRRANALALEANRRRRRSYDPDGHRDLIDRVIETFTPALFDRLAGAGDDTRRPVFVVGLPRSGTTLVEQILASHSRVHGAGELRLARKALDAVPAAVGRDGRMSACFEALTAAHVNQIAGDHLAALAAIVSRDGAADAADRVVDKMPENALYLGWIALLFPNATLIHVRRDPRDVALSCWMANFNSIRWANDPSHIAARIREHRRLMAYWDRALSARIRIHHLDYERLVDHLEGESRGLLAACGLDWEPACLRFHETRRPVRTASKTQVRRRLYRSSVARWERYRDHLAELFDLVPPH